MVFTPIKNYPNFGTFKIDPTIPFPATLANGATWSSDLISGMGNSIMAACTMDQVGTLTIQRYADLAGLVPVGPVATQALTAGTAAWAGVADALPWLTFSVAILNSSGVLANLSNCSILGGAMR